MAESILGKKYQLSLVFIGEKRAQKLNLSSRGKNYTPNILSFPLDKSNGEIFICESKSASEAKNFNLSKKAYVGFLFIHGCLHLKGFAHGDKMEKKEKFYLKKFGLK